MPGYISLFGFKNLSEAWGRTTTERKSSMAKLKEIDQRDCAIPVVGDIVKFQGHSGFYYVRGVAQLTESGYQYTCIWGGTLEKLHIAVRCCETGSDILLSTATGKVSAIVQYKPEWIDNPFTQIEKDLIRFVDLE